MPLTAATGGGSWQDDNNDDAGIGIGVGIGAGPNSGGNNGDCVLPLHPRGGGLRGQATCHDDEPRVAGQLRTTTTPLVATRACG